MKKALWDALLDAELNCRYWKHLVLRYSRRDKATKIFLALTSSGVVAGWGFWAEAPLVWKSLSSIAAIVAIAQPFLNLRKSIERMSYLHGKWSEIRSEYDAMWRLLSAGAGGQELSKQFDRTKAKEVILVKEETTLPDDTNLLIRCQAEVKKSYGI